MSTGNAKAVAAKSKKTSPADQNVFQRPRRWRIGFISASHASSVAVQLVSKHLRLAGVTSLMSVETPELLGSATLGGLGISAAADNVVLLRYVETRGRRR